MYFLFTRIYLLEESLSPYLQNSNPMYLPSKPGRCESWCNAILASRSITPTSQTWLLPGLAGPEHDVLGGQHPPARLHGGVTVCSSSGKGGAIHSPYNLLIPVHQLVLGHGGPGSNFLHSVHIQSVSWHWECYSHDSCSFLCRYGSTCWLQRGSFFLLWPFSWIGIDLFCSIRGINIMVFTVVDCFNTNYCTLHVLPVLV